MLWLMMTIPERRDTQWWRSPPLPLGEPMDINTAVQLVLKKALC